MNENHAAVNQALNDYYFGGRFEMRPVHLGLEGEAAESVAAALKVAPNELSGLIGQCVVASLHLDRPNPYIGYARTLKAWNPDEEAPPFTVLLCALSLAAEHMKKDADLSVSERNYYERLFELLNVTDETAKSRLKNRAKETLQFWDALELWLARHDFLLGQPTARASGNWKYAGLAMSQALVKDADRDRLSRLFQAEKLMPGEIISEADMAFHIDRWMRTHGASGPNRWLQKLWDSGEARGRIIEAALEELENWQGVDEKTAAGRTTRVRLHWQLAFSGFPRRAGLLLKTRRGGQEEALTPDGDLETDGAPLFLEEADEPGVFCLGPVASLSINQLLVRPVTLIGQASGMVYRHLPRAIIPLARLPGRPHFHEVPQVRLIAEHAILCNEAWLGKIIEHLAERARPGYAILRPDDMPGIPAGWCLLRGIEMMRAPDDKDQDLEALNPVANTTTTIACTGGLELRQGIWHAAVPPVIEAVSEKLECGLHVVQQKFPEDDETLKIFETENGFIRATLTGAAATSGLNLRALIKARKTELARTAISLRSADTPAPLRRAERQRFCHPIDPQSGFTAKPAHPSEDGITALEGCFLHGDTSLLDSVQLDSDPPDSFDVPGGSLETREQPEWRAPVEGEQEQETCMERGYHYWIIERFEKGDRPSAPKKAECKDCHLQTWTRKKKGQRSKLPPIPVRGEWGIHTDAESDTENPAAIASDEFLVSPDIVFDGLCYLGHGDWSTFMGIVAATGQETWMAETFATDLFALGHIETVHPFRLSKTAWSVPPPVLVRTSDGAGFLSGFHSPSLLANISEALAREGARHCPETTPSRVTVHRWDGLDGVEVAAALAEIKDPHGRPVHVAEGLAGIIAHQLPSLDAIWESAEPVDVERTYDIWKFDTATMEWRESEMKDDGAYRMGERYLFRDADGNVRQVGHRTAKILAARSAGMQLHGYDASHRRFVATLGAEPPGLFARALVASSGRLPTQDDQRVAYTDVAPATATTVLGKLGGNA